MGNPASGKFKPGERSPEIAGRWASALELRKAGVSFPQIARRLGYSGPGAAFKAVQSALDATLREPAESLRTLEAERLDRLMLGVWQRATAGDAKAVDNVLKIMDRRARLLGLDAPRKVAPTTPDGNGSSAAGLPPGAAEKIGALIGTALARRDQDADPPEPE
jgi:hypothetical protein